METGEDKHVTMCHMLSWLSKTQLAADVQRQTAVTADSKSKQLLLFAFAVQHSPT